MVWDQKVSAEVGMGLLILRRVGAAIMGAPCSKVSKGPACTISNSREEQMVYGQISHQALKVIRKFKENSKPWRFPFFSALSPGWPFTNLILLCVSFSSKYSSSEFI